MSLKSKIEAVIYASEEPVTLPQLAGLLGEEAEAELDALAALQTSLPLHTQANGERDLHAGDAEQASATTAIDAPVPPAQEAMPADLALVSHEILPLQEESPSDHPTALSGPATPTPHQPASPDSLDAEATPDPRLARDRERRVREHLRRTVDTLIRDYADSDRGIEIREVAGGFRMGTKPEYHDAVRGFVKSLKPALRLTLQALETLAVVAYKQPVTAAEISEIRGVDSAGVLGGLMARKLIATAGRKQVIGRPMLYKTTKEFLVRFGLKDVQELPSMEEFERLAGELNEQEDLPMEPTGVLIERANARGDADHIREVTGDGTQEPDPAADPATASTRSPSPAADVPAHSATLPRNDAADRNDTMSPRPTDALESTAGTVSAPVEAEPSSATHPTSNTPQAEA